MKKTDKNFNEFVEEMTKVWGTCTKMIDFCTKQASQVVRLTDGSLVEFETQHIEKNFCFGYSSCGQGPEWDDAVKSEESARKHMQSHFTAENMRRAGFDELLKDLQDENRVLYYGKKYDMGEKLMYWHCIYPCEFESKPWLYRKDSMLKSANQEADKAILLTALKEEKEKFEKRLHAWWKRYGADKIRTWTYWLDE